MHKKNNFSTVSIHGSKIKDAYRSHLTPIYSSSTYLFDSAEQAADIFNGKEPGYVYGRFGNPSTNEVEEKIAALESLGLELELKAILHASGMAALTTLLLSLLQSGQKVLTHYSLYGGTQEMLDKVLPALGIQPILCNFKNFQEVEQHLKADQTIGLVYIETPANPTLQCVDIETIAQLAKQYKKKVAVDNTFATPYLQQPFALGADFVIHSTTKFLNGHGTAIGGILLGKDLEFMRGKVTKHHRLLGGNSNGFDAFLLNNGLKTLALRMEQHCKNATILATYLHQHPKVAFVNHLSLDSHPDYTIAQKQMKHAGALMSFELKGGYDSGKQFLNHLNMCTHAVSLGTADTLVSHPASTTHVGVARDLRIASGITDGLIRLSVGIENIEDIISDIEQSLEQIV